MKCISCAAEFNDLCGICSVCGFNHHNDLAILRPVQAKTKLQVDLILGIDTDATGSSQAFTNGLRTMFRAFVEPLVQKIASIKIYHQTHRDLEIDEPEQFVSQGTTSFEQYLNEASSIRFEGGGDIPETHLDAIEHLLTKVPWPSPNARSHRGALIVFANADSKPTRSGASAAELGERIHQLGLLTYLVVDNPEFDCWKELRRTSCAEVLPLSNNPRMEDCVKVATALGRSIVATVASGATRPLLESALAKTRPMPSAINV